MTTTKRIKTLAAAAALGAVLLVPSGSPAGASCDDRPNEECSSGSEGNVVVQAETRANETSPTDGGGAQTSPAVRANE